jgi:hypothetical protein
VSLVEIARFSDVYEAELAAAFLASHNVDVTLTERHQTTIDPVMQRAFGLRLLAPTHPADAARDLLARAQAGEFSEPADDMPEPRTPPAHALGALMAVATAAAGGFSGTSLPRRLRPVQVVGLVLILLFIVGSWVFALA